LEHHLGLLGVQNLLSVDTHCAVACILCLQPGLDLQEHLQKEAALKKMGCTLQPHMVVCEDMNNIDNLDISIAYAVIQSNVYYELPTIVAAVDVCVSVLCDGFELWSRGKVVMGLHAERTMIFTPDTTMQGQKYYSFS